MKKLYLLIFCTALFNSNAMFGQCSVDFTTSADNCSGTPVSVRFASGLSNSTGNNGCYTFTWNFGDATPNSNLQNPTHSYANPGSYSVTLTIGWSGAFGCGGAGSCSGVSVTKIVNVASTPDANFTSTAPQCVDAAIDFTNTSANAGQDISSYEWDFGPDATPRTSNVPDPEGIKYSTSGTKAVTLNVTNSLGCTGTITQNITVDATPTADFTTTAPQCTNAPVDFTNTGTSAGVTWAWDFGSGATPANSTNQNETGVVYATAGSKVITLTITNSTTGCTDVSTQTININETPTVSFTHTAPQCTNTAVDFTNTGTTGSNLSFSWDFGDDAVPALSTAESPAGITYTSSGTKTVTFQITTDAGCSNIDVQTITIDPTPTVDFVSTGPECTGLAVDFTNLGTSAGVTWSWNFGSGAAPATSTSQNPTGVVYSTAGSKVITLTTTNSTSGCAVTATKTVDINLTPTVTFTHNAPQCANTAVNFTNTGSTGTQWNYSWDFGDDASPAESASENPMGITYTTTGTKTVTFRITSDEGCTSVTTQTLTISATPTVDFVSTAMPECTGLPVDFTNLGTSTGVTWAWNFGSGATPPTSTAQNPTGVIYSTAGSKVITLTITNSTTSCAVTATKTIDINQTPTASFTSTAPQCVGTGVDFTNTGSTGGQWSYSWDLGSGAQPKSSSSENPVNIKYDSAGTKTVTFTVFNTFCTQTSTQTIAINALPVADAGRDTIICANTTVQIGSVAVIGNTYSWFPTSTLNSSVVANPVSSPDAPDNQYIVTVRNTGTGCVNYDTINITMLKPVIANAGIDLSMCRFDSEALTSRTVGYDEVQIGAALIEDQYYEWTPALGILTSTNSPSPYVSPDSTTTYTVTVWGSKAQADKVCGPEVDEVTVTVFQLPEANAGPDDTITKGSSIQLVATGGIQYLWRPAYRLDNIGINTPIADPEFTTEYIVKVTDVHGCIKEDSVIITVITPSVWIPNAFTPNGDGKSDVFMVRGDGIDDFEFGVFNRWGEQVFYTQNMGAGWDGTRPVTGEQLPAGAYIYYVKGIASDGTIVDTKGMINLIR